MAKITLIIENDQIKSKVEGELDYIGFLQVIGTFSLQTMNNLLANAPAPHTDAIKGDIFDKFNLMATNVLNLFAPEYELNPDIETEALLRHENEIIEERYEAFLKDPANASKLVEFKKRYTETLNDLTVPNKPKGDKNDNA